MIKMILFMCVAALTLVLVSGASPAHQIPGAIKVEVHLVEVYATVHDHKGGYVDGLARDNFQVFDDGQAERITNFETSGQSLSCGILLDTTGSMAEALPRVKNSIVKLIDALDPLDSVGIYTFDSRLTVRQEFTTDKQAAKRAILRTRAEGQTALFDALSEAAQEVAARAGKKVLIVFTDGDDNASALNATAAIARAKKLGIPPGKEAQRNRRSLRKNLGRTKAPVHDCLPTPRKRQRCQMAQNRSGPPRSKRLPNPRPRRLFPAIVGSCSKTSTPKT